MREIFKKQLDETKPLTKDVLNELSEKTYFNGEEKKIGDIVLVAALFTGETFDKENGYPIVNFKVITLNENHFNLFEYDKKLCDEECIEKYIPRIKLKKEYNISDFIQH